MQGSGVTGYAALTLQSTGRSVRFSTIQTSKDQALYSPIYSKFVSHMASLLHEAPLERSILLNPRQRFELPTFPTSAWMMIRAMPILR